MSSYRTEAVVIKATDFDEADKILTLLTKHHGKISAIAKGVRKIESRKSGSLDLLSHAVLFLAQGRNLDIILETDLLSPFRNLKEDLTRASFAYQIAEIVGQLTPERQENPALFTLLTEALKRLDNTSDKEEAQKIVRSFELKFLNLTGYRPQLVKCVGCNQLLTAPNNRFSARLGGVLCSGCAITDITSRSISNETIKIMRFLIDEDWDQIGRLSYPKILNTELEQQTKYYLEYLLEKELKSSKFVEKVNDIQNE